MSAIKISITTQCRDGEKAIFAYVRSKDAKLACHPNIVGDGFDETAWVITHLPTGRQVNPSRTRSMETALALIDSYCGLSDWSLDRDDFDAMRALQAKVEKTFDAFCESLNVA
ncbi:MAG: hypothetical protein C4523_00035 [Myxococcales bacterium]|nr:MAG: hypothetical protein C4523_00035 [Myxococcales bacterium]